jgi:hypothetical protein
VLYDQLRSQLEGLVPLFALTGQAGLILATFDAVCRESLAIDLARRAPELSRINADGTPLQFSLALSRKRSTALQFLGESGVPGASMQQRRSASFTSLRALATCCGVVDKVEHLIPILCRLAPEKPDFLDNPSGVFWLAPSFWPNALPAVTVYVNARWGNAMTQWARLDDVAAFFNTINDWQRIAAGAMPALSPLGVAFTVGSRRATSGRIYLHAFGEPMRLYRELLSKAVPWHDARNVLDGFMDHVLCLEDRQPTRSAVFSVELMRGEVVGAKFEHCAHCAFDHDAHAARRIDDWLQRTNVDAAIYRDTVSHLNFGRALSNQALPTLHAYVGVGFRDSEHYTSVYFNPGPALDAG